MGRTDQELIAALKNGEEESARLLYERHYAFAVKVSRRILHSLDDAMDVTQDVFMHILVLKKIENFRGESQFSSWLYRIVINKSISLLKRKQRMLDTLRENVQNYVQLGQHANQTINQLQRIEHKERMHSIYQALEKLPGQYGYCIYLRYFEGDKYREIAKKMRMTRDRVGMQIMRSRNLLHKNQALREQYIS